MLKIVILNQNISEWVNKGEVQKNYFNFNKEFKSLIIISLGKYSTPSKEIMEKLCGTKHYKYFSFNNPILSHKLLKYLLPSALYKILIFKEIKEFNLSKPALIWSLGDCYCGFVSKIIASYLNSSLVVSIHTYESFEIFFFFMSFKEKIIYLLNRRFKKESHDFASKILVVYEKIKENIDEINKRKVFVEYNKINISEKNVKKVFKTNKIINLVFVGRLIKGKCLLNILKAIRQIENVKLTVFGDGPHRSKLEKFIHFNNLENKILMKGFVNNDIIIKSLKNYDAFIAFHKYYEFPKTIIESLLIGLPVILNKDPSNTLKEFKNLEILWADDNTQSYLKILNKLSSKQYNLKEISQRNLIKVKQLINTE